MGNITSRIAVLGSTGSIGRQTLEVVRTFPQRFRIIGLAASKNLDLLAEQVKEFKPKFVYFREKEANTFLKDECEFLPLEEIARHPEVDTVVTATPGASGLLATISAVESAKKVALANKEALVMTGDIIIREVKRKGAQIIPVDSEHSAIWQCLQGEHQKAAQILLTASGGPFLRFSPAQLSKVTAEQALKHPSWQMGRKVTIDSATLMNKGLEVIEAHWLFDMPFDKIQVLIHPQSLIHSLVEFPDGSVKAQLSYPDMRLPIQYALTYPKRLPNPELPRLNWDSLTSLTFEQPDLGRFPCLKLAIEAGKKGGTYPAVLCAADEVAVELFLSGQIGFSDIAHLVAETLQQHLDITQPNLDEILAADDWAREKVSQLACGDGSC
jgi:1-deoxy-D-xylulose-5-phosphate reductoisomerase